jgi:hypothetical protein
VFFEFWPAGLGYAGSEPGDLLEFFLRRGFSLSELAPGGVHPLAGRDVAQSMKVTDLSWKNLLATRE